MVTAEAMYFTVTVGKGRENAFFIVLLNPDKPEGFSKK